MREYIEYMKKYFKFVSKLINRIKKQGISFEEMPCLSSGDRGARTLDLMHVRHGLLFL